MNKYGYKEVRTLDREDLRSLCIKQNWCTRADNEEYSELLDMTTGEITTDDIVVIADVIYSLSSLDSDHDTKEHFSNICFLLFKTCNTFIEEI